MHLSKSIWDASSAYDWLSNNNYYKSKRTFERDILDINFYPKIVFDQQDKNLKKIVFNAWFDIAKSKRYLFIKISISLFNDKYFIFFEDNRGKKYWQGVETISEKEIFQSLTKFIEHINKTCVMWPSLDLMDCFYNIVKSSKTETVINNKDCSLIIPISAFKKILTDDDLVQPNEYSLSSNVSNKTLTHLDKIEAEAIHIIRETVAEAEKPVML